MRIGAISPVLLYGTIDEPMVLEVVGQVSGLLPTLGRVVQIVKIDRDDYGKTLMTLSPVENLIPIEDQP